jgi:hypothetical protein
MGPSLFTEKPEGHLVFKKIEIEQRVKIIE